MDNNNPHILGTAPIGKLLVQYSLPSIIGMTLTSLYNIIDSIFIGHGVGPLAISGLAITPSVRLSGLAVLRFHRYALVSATARGRRTFSAMS